VNTRRQFLIGGAEHEISFVIRGHGSGVLEGLGGYGSRTTFSLLNKYIVIDIGFSPLLFLLDRGGLYNPILILRLPSTALSSVECIRTKISPRARARLLAVLNLTTFECYGIYSWPQSKANARP